LVDEPIIYQRSAPSKIIGQQTHETENKVRLDLPRIIQRKENAPEFDYSSFYTKTGAGDPLLVGANWPYPGQSLKRVHCGKVLIVTRRTSWLSLGRKLQLFSIVR
jgi:hypothetical protein